VGNEEYARENHSFGLTTLIDEHLVAAGEGVEFVFRGKSGKEHRIGISDRRLVRLVKQCQDLPGQQLFQYVDEAGHVRDIESGDVNAYIEALAGADFTAKDFRTWAGTLLVACELGSRPWKTQAQAKALVVQAVKAAASRLGNTPAVCRKSYIHPAIITAYLDGAGAERLWARRHHGVPGRHLSRSSHDRNRRQ
jgi:DNA topoisomerase-1